MATATILKSIIKLSSIMLLSLLVLGSNLLIVSQVRAEPPIVILSASSASNLGDTPVELSRQALPKARVDQHDQANLPLTISRNFLHPELTPAYIDYVGSHEIKHGERNQVSVALTFDCEGEAEQIETMVDLLDVAGAKGTFFLVGETVAAAPQVVPRILASGHEIGNHSYNHPHFTTLTQTEVISEVLLAEQAISVAAGEPLPLRYFRFPYGDRTPELKQWIAALGYQSIFWDVDPRGWHAAVTSTQVISTVINKTQPGSIILMHCGRAADEAALPTVITELKAQGYTLATLSQVLPPDPVWVERE